jgi:hypothetical protein
MQRITWNGIALHGGFSYTLVRVQKARFFRARRCRFFEGFFRTPAFESQASQLVAANALDLGFHMKRPPCASGSTGGLTS